MAETIKTGRLLRSAELSTLSPDKVKSEIGSDPIQMLEDIDLMYPNAGDIVDLQISTNGVIHLESAIRTDTLIAKKVFVASESEIKKVAVSNGVKGVEVIMVKSESGLDSQPMGMKMIREGVINRLKSAIENGATGKICAIENGLIKKKGKYYDVGMVLVFDSITENYAMTLTEEVRVPTSIVKTVIRRGTKKTTWGKILAEKYPGKVDRQDPHKFITNGEMSRIILMSEAVSEADRILEVYKR